MNFFKKEKLLPDVIGIGPEVGVEGTQATTESVEIPSPDIAPAYSAGAILGGLGWYRTQYQ